MMIILLGAVLLAVQPADSLKERVEARIAQIPGASAGIAYIDLESGESFFRNADSSFHAASTMKVPVMIELFRSARSGRLSMKQGILVVNQFASIVDGSPYSLDAASDGDTTLYRRIGRRVPVDTLLRLMITRSSNLATNTLIALVGAEEVTRVMRGLGARHIEVGRGGGGGKAYERGLNTATAGGVAVMRRAREDGKRVTPQDRPQRRDGLLARWE